MLKRVIVVATVAGLALAACSTGSEAPPAGGDAGSGADGLVDPVVEEGGELGSCVFEFSPETLAEREWAFDGTVTEIREPAATEAPYEVEFDVARWYAGDVGGPTATVRTYDVSGTSLAGDLGLKVGQRVLASGDDDFLWGCGFSRAYSEAEAKLFEEAFA